MKRRGWLSVGLVLAAGAATFMTATPAFAAGPVNVTGTGSGSSSTFELSPGLYAIDLSYSGNSDEFGASNFIGDLESINNVDDLIVNDIAVGNTVHKIEYVDETDTFWLDIGVAESGASWQASVSPVAAPTSTVATFSATGQSRNATSVFRLAPGTYSVAVSYSGNTDYFGPTNFIADLQTTDDYYPLVNDIDDSRAVSVNVKVTEGGSFWFEPEDASQSATWSVQIALLSKTLAAPDAPEATTATGGLGSAQVSWAAPREDGGSAITGYVVTASPGGRTATTTGATSVIFAGLPAGTYTFTVRAKNAIGTSPASEASAPTTVAAPVVAAPSAPSKPSVKSLRKGALTITWRAPASNGSPITAYTVYYGSHFKKVGGSKTTLTLSKLKKGSYKVQVSATNAAGTSTGSPVVTAKVK